MERSLPLGLGRRKVYIRASKSMLGAQEATDPEERDQPRLIPKRPKTAP
jgi:hypothetical protein